VHHRIIGLLAVVGACLVMVGFADSSDNPTHGAAPAPPKPPAAVTFAGKVSGTNAYVAVVSLRGRVEAYVCDSVTTAVWLKGVHKGRVVSAVNAAKKVRLNAQVTGSKLTGHVTLAGKRHSIRLAKVSYRAGLWKAFGLVRGKLFEAGWIVLPDGSQRGAGKFPPDGPLQPVQPVNTVKLSGGQTFSIASIGASTSPAGPVTTASCATIKQNWDLFNKAFNNTNASAAATQAALNGMVLNNNVWKRDCQDFFGPIATAPT
jgi:hypothetical protein